MLSGPPTRTLDWVQQKLAIHEPVGEAARTHAAVALILREASDKQGCEGLFILRAEHPDDPWSGHMGLPGGRVEPSDESALAAAKRETLEEVAIDLDRQGRLLGQIDDVRASARGRRLDLAVTPFVFAVDAVSPRGNHEVQEIHWFDLRQLLDPAAASTKPYVYEGVPLQLPCYHVHDRVIWGLTFKMLQLFFAATEWRSS
jgi:8-oxo-dGTP pyrophosphatase MutT (NUDIX family)